MARRNRGDYNSRRRRRRRKRMIATLLAAMMIAGAIIAAVTVFFKVADFEVTGSSLYTAEEIVAASEIKVGDNMFAINKFDAANRIYAKFPYIGEVRIRRRLPDTFTFEIIERKSAAVFCAEKLNWITDRDGYLLESVPTDQTVALPKISGATLMAPSPGTKAVLSETDAIYTLTKLLAAIEDGGITEKVGKVDITKLYSLTISYENRFVVELGNESELEKKIRMLKAVIERLEPTDRGTINISNPKEARFRPNANIVP